MVPTGYDSTTIRVCAFDAQPDDDSELKNAPELRYDADWQQVEKSANFAAQGHDLLRMVKDVVTDERYGKSSN